MTVSGTITFSVSRDNILNDALAMVGAIGVEDTGTTAQITHAARQLNMIVKSWESFGIDLWARQRFYILPQQGADTTRPGEVSATTGQLTTSYTQTTIATNAANAATTISVTSATGFGSGYYVGVELDGGKMLWTTQSGAAVGTTVTLNTALTTSASAGNFVYVYQTKANRPLRVVDMIRHNQQSGTDTPGEMVPLVDYNRLGYKPSSSYPFWLTYDPQMDLGGGAGMFYIYPTFADGKSLIMCYGQRSFDDFDASTDTPDFPQEYYLCMVYALAVVLAPTYGLPITDRQLLSKEADKAFAVASENEPEEGSFRIMPRNKIGQ